jgi:hypothetical protein
MAYDPDDYEDFIPQEAARVKVLQNAMHANRLMAKGGAWEALIDRALADAHEAINVLVHTEFTTLDQVREQQWKAMRYESLARYINDIMAQAKYEMLDMTQESADSLAKLIGGEMEQGD